MSTRHRYLLVAILSLVLALMLAACGGDDDKDQQKQPEASATPEPLVLSETVSCSRQFSMPSRTVNYSMRYPGGWLGECPAAIEIRNLDFSLPNPPGTVRITATVNPFLPGDT